MAIFNEILVRRYNRALQKIFGIKGSPPVRQVAGEITPAISMFYGVEHRITESWNRYAIGVAAGPVAAQVCNFRYRNPRGSGVLAVLEKVIFFPQQNDTLSWGRILAGGTTIILTDLTVAVSGIALDFRQIDNGSLVPQPSNSAIRASRDTGSSANNFNYGFVSVLANTSYDLINHEDQQITLAPGEVVQFDSGTVNGKCFLTTYWRERAMEESEAK